MVLMSSVLRIKQLSTLIVARKMSNHLPKIVTSKACQFKMSPISTWARIHSTTKMSTGGTTMIRMSWDLVMKMIDYSSN